MQVLSGTVGQTAQIKVQHGRATWQAQVTWFPDRSPMVQWWGDPNKFARRTVTAWLASTQYLAPVEVETSVGDTIETVPEVEPALAVETAPLPLVEPEPRPAARKPFFVGKGISPARAARLADLRAQREGVAEVPPVPEPEAEVSIEPEAEVSIESSPEPEAEVPVEVLTESTFAQEPQPSPEDVQVEVPIEPSPEVEPSAEVEAPESGAAELFPEVKRRGRR